MLNQKIQSRSFLINVWIANSSSIRFNILLNQQVILINFNFKNLLFKIKPIGKVNSFLKLTTSQVPKVTALGQWNEVKTDWKNVISFKLNAK